MNIVIKCYCRSFQLAFRPAFENLETAYRNGDGLAVHAAREANPLYPVPRLMDAAELELFYEKAADWSR